MSDAVFKQLMFDCAMELLYGHEGLGKEHVAYRILDYIKRHDEGERYEHKSNNEQQ